MPVPELDVGLLARALAVGEDELVVDDTSEMTVGCLLVIRSEAMKVVDIRSSTQVRVVRGVEGTQVKAYPNGERFYVGLPEKFKAIKESLTAVVGDSGTFPDFMLPGQRATDDKGNEYVLVNMTSAASAGSSIVFNAWSFLGSIPTPGRNGSVGILTEQCTSSDVYAWLQIYGYYGAAQEAGGTSLASSLYVPIVATSVSSPNVGMTAVPFVGLDGYVINGMVITGAATTATTSATTATGVGVPVWLNYPWISTLKQSGGATSP